MQNKTKAVLIEGPVGPMLAKLTGPMLIGMVGMVMFNLVDTYFVGRLGTAELAAMSFTLPVVMLQGSISMGLGVGASSVIAGLIGRQETEQVKRQTTASLLLSFLIVAILVAIGMLTVDPLFGLMGAEGQTLVLIKKYMYIWYPGLAFVVIPMVGNSVMRAAGNTVIPTVIMLFAICVNIVLDPLLIYGIGPFPRLGLQGAALATVIARACTFTASLLILHFKFNMLAFRFDSVKQILTAWSRMLFIGVPAAVTQLILPVSMGVITRMVAAYGDAAVAAVGVGSRIDFFALSPVITLGSIMVPFVGQNLGAGKFDRIKEAVKISLIFSLSLGGVLFILSVLLGRYIGGIFNKNPLVIDFVSLYLLIISASYGLQGFLVINTSVLNALKKPIHSTGLNVLRMFILYIPLGYVLSLFFDLKGIFAGALISAIAAGLVSWKVTLFEVEKISKQVKNT